MSRPSDEKLGLDRSKHTRRRFSMSSNYKPKFRLNRSPKVGSCSTHQDSGNDVNLNVSTTDFINQAPTVSISSSSATTTESVSLLSTPQGSVHIPSQALEMNRGDINTRPALEEERFKPRPTLSHKRSLNPTPSSNEDPSNKCRRIYLQPEDMDNMNRPVPGSRLSNFSKQFETVDEASTQIHGRNGQTHFGRTKGQDRLKALQDKLKNVQKDQPIGSPTQQGNVMPGQEDNPTRASHDPRPSLTTGASNSRPTTIDLGLVPKLSQVQDSPLTNTGRKRGGKRSRLIEDDGSSLHKKTRTECSEDQPRKNTSAQDRLKAYQDGLQRDMSATSPSTVLSHSALVSSGSANWQPGSERPARVPHGTTRPMSRITVPRTASVRAGSERPASVPYSTTRPMSRITVPRSTSVHADVSGNWQLEIQHQTIPGIVSHDSKPSSSGRPTARRKSRIAAPKSNSVHSGGTSNSKEHSISETVEQSVSSADILQSDYRNLNSTWHSGSQRPEINDAVRPPDRSLRDSRNHQSSTRPENSPPERPTSESRINNATWHFSSKPYGFPKNSIPQQTVKTLERTPTDSRSNNINQISRIHGSYPRENSNAGDGSELLRHSNVASDELRTSVDSNSEYDMEWEPSSVELKTVMDDAQNIRQQLSAKAISDGASSSPLQEDYHIVIDTNIFLAHLKFLEHLRDTHFKVLGLPKLVVSWIVLQELDGLKVGKYARGQKTNPVTQLQAIKAIRWINSSLRSHPDRVQGDEDFAKNAVDNMVTCTTKLNGDDNLIVTCLNMIKAAKNVMLLSNDVNLRNKACLLKITSRSKDELDEELKSKTVQKLSLFYETKLPMSQKQQTVLQLMKRSLTKALGQKYEKMCNTSVAPTTQASRLGQAATVSSSQSPRSTCPSVQKTHSTLNHQELSQALKSLSSTMARDYVEQRTTSAESRAPMWNAPISPTPLENRVAQPTLPRDYVDQRTTPTNSRAPLWNAPISPTLLENSTVTFPPQSQSQNAFSSTLPKDYVEQCTTPTDSRAPFWNAPISPTLLENSTVTFPPQSQSQNAFSSTLPKDYVEQRTTPTDSRAPLWNAPISPTPLENSTVTFPPQSQVQSTLPRDYDEQSTMATIMFSMPVSPTMSENSNDAMDFYENDSCEEDTSQEDLEVVVRFLKKIERQLHGFCGHACHSLGLNHPVCRDLEISPTAQRTSPQYLLSSLNRNEDLNRILIGGIEKVLSVPAHVLSQEHSLIAALYTAIVGFAVDNVDDFVFSSNVSALCQSEPGRQDLGQTLQRYKEFQDCFVVLRTRLLTEPSLHPM